MKVTEQHWNSLREGDRLTIPVMQAMLRDLEAAQPLLEVYGDRSTRASIDLDLVTIYSNLKARRRKELRQ